MKKLSLLFCLLLLSIIHFGQTTNLGVPLGWGGKIAPDRDVPLKEMPGFEMARIQQEDAENEFNKSIPWRFGYKYDTNYSLDNAGVWTTMENGDRLWRLRIACPDAETINLLIADYYLPQGASLHLYDINRTNKVGAYTARNNREDGLLGTELVHGEEIVVEYFEPAEVEKNGTLTITSVVHGYRSLSPIQARLDRELNGSGDCNIDVNCPLGDGWENQIKSVAMIVVDGSGICTGALVNNTCNDGTPYFLTADHCLGETGFWAFRFNWESPEGTEVCAATDPSTDPGPPYDQTANGATILANSDAPDFALLLIDNMDEFDAALWGVFYAGWDNSDEETVTQGTGIHHTSGDVKKICREDNPPYQVTEGGQEFWQIDDWEEGVTEPGSSGSPLFDQEGRIIGQLCCGLAACDGVVDNGEYDQYGRFGYAWDLLDIGEYLAPDDCGGAVTNDGWIPEVDLPDDDAGIMNIVAPVGFISCNSTVEPKVRLRNYGGNELTSVTILYNVDGGADESFDWTGALATGEIEEVVLPAITVPDGVHEFNVSTNEPNGNTDPNPDNDSEASDFSVMAEGTSVTLVLTTDCYGSETTWEVVDEDDNVVANGGPYEDSFDGGEEYTMELCLPLGCYDFVLYDSYGDGMEGGDWCPNDGNYVITLSETGEELASMIADNAAFGESETNNFCIEEGGDSGLEEGAFDFAVFPNPSEGVFNIRLNSEEKVIFSVFDMTGRQVMASSIDNGNNFSFDLSDKAEGTYLLEIRNENGDKITKILTVY